MQILNKYIVCVRQTVFFRNKLLTRRKVAVSQFTCFSLTFKKLMPTWSIYCLHPDRHSSCVINDIYQTVLDHG